MSKRTTYVCDGCSKTTGDPSDWIIFSGYASVRGSATNMRHVEGDYCSPICLAKHLHLNALVHHTLVTKADAKEVAS